MWVARRTGMKGTSLFRGFGLRWSTRRGETEYGGSLGGCDIMTVEEPDPSERDRAMYKQATWKRVAVLFAGPREPRYLPGVIYAIALVTGLLTCIHNRAVIAKLAALHRK